VSLSIKEIYKLICPECREKLEKLVKDKLQDNMVKQILEGGSGRE
jgi:hypothetical protein